MSLQLAGKKSNTSEGRINYHGACYLVRVIKHLLNNLYFVHPCGVMIMISFPRGKKYLEDLRNLSFLIKWTM